LVLNAVSELIQLILIILIAMPIGDASVRLTDILGILLMIKVLEQMDVRFITTQMT
jgi:hypothetical protein